MSDAGHGDAAIKGQSGRRWFSYWEFFAAMLGDAFGLLAIYYALMMFLAPGWSKDSAGFLRAAALYVILPTAVGIVFFATGAWLRRHALRRGFKRSRSSRMVSIAGVVLLVVLIFLLANMLAAGQG